MRDESIANVLFSDESSSAKKHQNSIATKYKTVVKFSNEEHLLHFF